jgi:hypothetical protein
MKCEEDKNKNRIPESFLEFMNIIMMELSENDFFPLNNMYIITSVMA